MHRHGIPTLLLTLALLLLPDQARSACTGSFGSTPTFQPAFPTVFTTYDPTRVTDTVVTVPITIVPPNGMSPPCTLIVNILPSFDPGMMNGSSSLAYTVGGDFAGAMTGSPFSGLTYQPQNGFPQTFTLTMTIRNRQNVPQGNYAETLSLRMFSSGATQPLFQTNITFSAQVLASCTLPAPNVSQLNFSSGVASGVVTNNYTLSTLISGASCSGPARLKLSGAPMQTGAAAIAGFDNRIHYRATARLNAASIVLSTDTAAEAQVSLGAGSGNVSVDVALIDKGKRLLAGTYSSVLSVTLEPAN